MRDISTPESAAQTLHDMMVEFIAARNGITKEEAEILYQSACKEMRENREKERQDRMTMEYGP